MNYLLLSQAAIYQRNRRLWLNFKNTAPMGLATLQFKWHAPQTLGYALADSPGGQGLWIYDKFMEWTDCGANPEAVLSMDEMLDNITLYWLTNTGVSAARLYKESFFTDAVRTELALPVALSIFMGDNFTPPKIWVEKTYSKLAHWNEVAKGGHFAAFEQPTAFVGELRQK